MNTELKNAVGDTDKEAQYDASAKRLLGQKWILAHILVKTVDAFKGMRPGEVIGYIEGTPQISTVSIEPGLTNQKRKRMVSESLVLTQKMENWAKDWSGLILFFMAAD